MCIEHELRGGGWGGTGGMLLHFLKRTVGHHMGLTRSQLVNSWVPPQSSHKVDAWQGAFRASLFLLIFF